MAIAMKKKELKARIASFHVQTIRLKMGRCASSNPRALFPHLFAVPSSPLFSCCLSPFFAFFSPLPLPSLPRTLLSHLSAFFLTTIVLPSLPHSLLDFAFHLFLTAPFFLPPFPHLHRLATVLTPIYFSF
ncbi:hypothetical protein BKA57DRAFT_117077 [Linnemannia elongata]|nr:hypothetical protein BKA57DRAFT_117077 [Linnemannia elongata]